MKNSIIYAPKGRHTIECHINGKAKRVTLDVTSDAVGRLNASLAELKASQIDPCGYYDHKQGARAFTARKFGWDEGKGITLEVDWTRSGKEAVEGGDYGYFSPRLALKDGKIAGLMSNSAEVGSLTNEPAFRAIPEVLTASHAVASESGEVVELCASLARVDFVENNPQVGDNNQKGKLPSPQTKMKEKLIRLLGLAEDVEDDAIIAALEAKLAAKKDGEGKLEVELDAMRKKAEEDKKEMEEVKASHASAASELTASKAQLEELQKKLDAQREASANTFVEALCSSGKIAPKNEKGKASWKAMYMNDPASAQESADCINASHSPTQLGDGENKGKVSIQADYNALKEECSQ